MDPHQELPMKNPDSAVVIPPERKTGSHPSKLKQIGSRRTTIVMNGNQNKRKNVHSEAGPAPKKSKVSGDLSQSRQYRD